MKNEEALKMSTKMVKNRDTKIDQVVLGIDQVVLKVDQVVLIHPHRVRPQRQVENCNTLIL